MSQCAVARRLSSAEEEATQSKAAVSQLQHHLSQQTMREKEKLEGCNAQLESQMHACAMLRSQLDEANIAAERQQDQLAKLKPELSQKVHSPPPMIHAYIPAYSASSILACYLTRFSQNELLKSAQQECDSAINQCASLGKDLLSLQVILAAYYCCRLDLLHHRKQSLHKTNRLLNLNNRMLSLREPKRVMVGYRQS